MFFLVHVMSSDCGHLAYFRRSLHLKSPTPLVSAISSQRLSLTLNSKLTSSALPYLWSLGLLIARLRLCTAELCKEDTIKLQSYWGRACFMDPLRENTVFCD